MLELSIHVAEADADRVSGLLFELGVSGFEERSHPTGVSFVLYADEHSDLLRLRAAFEELVQNVEPFSVPLAIEESTLARGAERAWLEYLGPEWLTPDIVMEPVHSAIETGARTRLVYQPLLAFGTGGHPTTKLAARAIERLLGERNGSLLDVGTGNGVLAFVALVSGATEVLGLDIDPSALAAARANANLNGFGEHLRFSSTPLADTEQSFDLVVANIDALQLTELAPLLCARTRRALILTGFLFEERGELEAHYRALGMQPSLAQELGEYGLFELRPAEPPARES